MLNNLDIASVHVHEGSLLTVVRLPTRKSWLKQGNWISELSCVICVLIDVGSLILCLIELRIITLSKFLLQIENLVLESKLIDLVLCLQGQNLIIGILAEALAIVGLLIEFLDLVNTLGNFAVVSLVNAVLVFQLLAPRVDILSEVTVLSLQIIQSVESFLTSILKKFDLVLITAHLGRSWPNCLQMLTLLLELISELLLLVTQDHVRPKIRESYS